MVREHHFWLSAVGRILPRKSWIAKRNPLEKWQGHTWVHKCFSALRRWCLRGGPNFHVFWALEVKGTNKFERCLAYSTRVDQAGERLEPPTEEEASGGVGSELESVENQVVSPEPIPRLMYM